MKTFTIADAFSHGWKKTKQHFWTAAGVLLAYAVISAGLGQMGEIAKTNLALNVSTFVLTLAIGVAIRIGITNFFLNADEGEGKFSDFFAMRGVFFTYFVAYIALSFFTVIGLILLIVPGVIFSLVYFFVPTLIVDKDMEVIEAFKESAAITKGHRLHLLAFLGVSALVNFVGILAAVVGLLVTIPMTFFAGIYIYRRLTNAELPVSLETPEQTV